MAERKVRTMLAAGARVHVFSPMLTPGLSRVYKDGRLHWTPRAYQPGDLHNFFIVICATDQAEVNRQAAAEARSAGALVNLADSPELSDFHVPAQITRGDLLITVATGGGSPALARRLKEDIAARYGPEYGEYLALVAKVRADMKNRLATAREREGFWRETIDPDVLNLLKNGKFTEAEERIRHAACCAGSES